MITPSPNSVGATVMIGTGQIDSLSFQAERRPALLSRVAGLKERAIDAICLLMSLGAAATLAGALLAASELPSLGASSALKLRGDAAFGERDLPASTAVSPSPPVSHG